MSTTLLRPQALTTGDYAVALKALKGSEKKVKFSTLPCFELGTMRITGLNAGTYTGSVADNAALAARPSALLAVLQQDVNGGVNDIVAAIIGTDQNDAVLSGMGRFTAPAYAQDRNPVFPGGWAVEIEIPEGKLFKSITSQIVYCDAVAKGGSYALFALPPLDSFNLIGCRVRLDYTTGVAAAAATQCGADESAFVKPGNKPVKTFTISGKNITQADGIARYNGVRVTGLAMEDKEDKLVIAHEFFIGLIATAKHSNPEGRNSGDDSMLEAEGIYEDYALVLAK